MLFTCAKYLVNSMLSKVGGRGPIEPSSLMPWFNFLGFYLLELIETICCLMGLPDNHAQQYNDVTSGHHLGFLNLQLFSYSTSNTENSEKTIFS